MNVRLFLLPLCTPLPPDAGELLCCAADEEKARRYRRDPAAAGTALSMTAQVLLRYAVSRTLACSMAQVRVAYRASGQPYLPGLPLFCSVSHTAGLCAVAVADAPVGLDAELLRPFPARVAQRVFTPQEQAQLHAAKDAQLSFFTFWTRHESFVKLTGAGLAQIAQPIPPWVDVQTTVHQEKYCISLSAFTNLS